MINRFYERKMAAPSDSVERQFCTGIMLSLSYSGSVWCVNRWAHAFKKEHEGDFE